jgi:hypothetical protein
LSRSFPDPHGNRDSEVPVRWRRVRPVLIVLGASALACTVWWGMPESREVEVQVPTVCQWGADGIEGAGLIVCVDNGPDGVLYGDQPLVPVERVGDSPDPDLSGCGEKNPSWEECVANLRERPAQIPDPPGQVGLLRVNSGWFGTSMEYEFIAQDGTVTELEASRGSWGVRSRWSARRGGSATRGVGWAADPPRSAGMRCLTIPVVACFGVGGWTNAVSNSARRTSLVSLTPRAHTA